MEYIDQCGAYDKPSNSYYTLTLNMDNGTSTCKRALLNTHAQGSNEFKVWVKFAQHKTNPDFKRRVIKVVEHPPSLDELNLRDKAIVEYTG